MRTINKLIACLVLLMSSLIVSAQSDWNVTASDYQYSMTVVCKINVEGDISKDANDKIGAFCNSECRGVASPDQSGNVYLTIYSNSAKNEVITLKVWDASANKQYTLTQTIYFEENATQGTMDSPLVMHTNIKNYRLKAFNMFSPNNDGKNDYWVVEDLTIVNNLQLIIFSVDGTQVYKHSKKGYDNSWAGKSEGGTDLPTGTYIYQFFDDDNKVVFRGSTTIVR